MADDRVERRYCALMQLAKSSSMARVAETVPHLIDMIKRWSNGEMEQLCRSSDGQLFGFLFISKKPAGMIEAEFAASGVSAHGDSIIVFEAGEEFCGVAGFSRAATWLQHHKAK
jgi:hypothetical protein